MIIQIDTRQQDRLHNRQIEEYIISHGCKTIHSKMLCGDYGIPNRMDVAVDTKQNIEELYKNLTTGHKRFREECTLAKECGIKLYILISNTKGITCIEDLMSWNNPNQFIYRNRAKKIQAAGGHMPSPPVSNETLIKIMRSMQRSYTIVRIHNISRSFGSD